MKISELLKTYRTKHHCTQEQLAEKLFVTHQSISKQQENSLDSATLVVSKFVFNRFWL